MRNDICPNCHKIGLVNSMPRSYVCDDCKCSLKIRERRNILRVFRDIWWTIWNGSKWQWKMMIRNPVTFQLDPNSGKKGWMELIGICPECKKEEPLMYCSFVKMCSARCFWAWLTDWQEE